MSDRRVRLASPYGSLLYQRGHEERFIDNGDTGTAIVYDAAGMCVVRWDRNADETDVPVHWLEVLTPEKAQLENQATPPEGSHG